MKKVISFVKLALRGRRLYEILRLDVSALKPPRAARKVCACSPSHAAQKRAAALTALMQTSPLPPL